jgi:hypothetical protein
MRLITVRCGHDDGHIADPTMACVVVFSAP